MKILLPHSHPLFSSQPLQWRNHPVYTLSPQVTRLLRLPVSAPRCVAAQSPADSTSLNGWDDLRLRVDPGHSGESNLIRIYLNSLGIDDKKYVIVYVLGFVCALAISRVRVPSIVVIPAAAIVFGIGFSIGFLNCGPRGVNSSGGKRKSKGEDLRVSGDKLRNLIKLFDDFDGRVGKLKGHISEAVQNQKVGVDDLKSYVDALELMGLCVKKARNVVDKCVDLDSVEDHEVDRNLNKKPNRKRKDSGESGFNWFQLAFRFFQDTASKKKEGIKNEFKHANNLSRDAVDEERLMNSKFASDARRPSRKDLDNAYYYQPLDVNCKRSSDYEGEKMDGVARNGNFSFMEMNKSREMSQSRTNERFIDSNGREINFHSNSVRFTDDQQVTLRMSEYDEIGQGISHDAIDDNLVFRSRQRNVSSRHAKLHRNFSGTFESSQYELEGSYENYSNTYGDKTYTEGNLLENNDQSRQETKFAASSSSVLSDDILFDKYLTEAYSLLKKAKDCLRVRDNEMPVEQMLHESTKLLSRALSLKPMSLLATGLLGNTYLLLGELKLRFSQELRFLISGSNDNEPLPTKDKLVSRLIDVCEECEELLVEAGRKYRMAMSIDGSDVRALYNWGVALSFRAQLIADIGPEAASDADKLFLAAIDKFDAMMSRSKTYAPDALYRWAMVLQQRSRLRPRNSKDKVKLLQQSKRLYEDALEMGFDKLQVREALFEFNPGQ